MRIAAEVIDTLVAHCRAVLPEEGCGLLALDAAGAVRAAYPAANVARSAVRFTVDPDAHFAALRHAGASGWHIGGDFHSHPRSAPVPSRTDLAGALDPDWVHLIVGLDDAVSDLRLWRLEAGRVVVEAVEVEAPCR